MLSFILFMLIPGNILGLGSLQQEIKKSYTYTLIAKNLIDRIPSIGKMGNTMEAISDPKVKASGKFNQNLENLRQDKRIQDILKDEELLKQIKNKDMSKVMTNPKILAIAQDEELLKKFFALYQQAPGKLQPTGPDQPIADEHLPNPE